MKIGIIGTGKIVSEVIPVIQEIDGITIVAICSRSHSRQKADWLAAEFSIGEVYDDYDLMLRKSDIDFVYVALANNAHFSYALKALDHGKHVIIEKPICTSTSELDALIQKSLANHLYIFEAVTLLHMPHFKILKEELLRQVGNIKLIVCNYSQRSSRYDLYLNNQITPAFDPACFGGALTDINIYNIQFVVALCGMPVEVAYHPNIGHNGIDTSGVAILHYPHFKAVCIGAKDSDGLSYGSIQGEDGWIENEGPVSRLEKFKIYVSEQESEIDVQRHVNRLRFEFEHFRDIYHSGDDKMMRYYLDLSHQVMTVLDLLRAS